MNAPVAATEDLIYSVEDGIARLTFDPSAGAQRADLCDVRADGYDLRDGQHGSLDQGDDPDRRRRQGVRVGHRHVAVPRLQDRGGRARIRGADRSRARRTLERAGCRRSGHCRCPAPVGGAGIAACCDIRIGTAATRIGFPIARTLGNCLSMSNISRVVALVGPARTKDLIFTARLIEAPEALSLGLLNEVVPDVSTLQRRADETAKLVAGHAPITMVTTRKRCSVSGDAVARRGPRPDPARLYERGFPRGMDAFLNKRRRTGRARVV